MKSNKVLSRTFRKEAEWKAIIDEWLATGKSSSVYAREKKIAESGLYNWRKRIYPHANKTKNKAKKKLDLFVPITLESPPPVTPKVTLTYPNGCQLHIMGMNEGILKMLNQAMGILVC